MLVRRLTPTLEAGRAADSSDWEGLGAYMLVYLQAVGLTSLTVKTLKLAVHRPMPFVYDFTPAEQGELDLFDYQAFPSGHTAHAFAGAGVVTFAMARRYGGSPATWIAGGAAHAAALAAGLVKIGVGIHYPTDVLAGALIGEAASLGVCWLHAVDAPVRPVAWAGPHGFGVGLQL